MYQYVRYIWNFDQEVHLSSEHHKLSVQPDVDDSG